MKLNFTLKYHTKWGERLFISGSCAELGNEDVNNALEMCYHNEDEWRLEVTLPDSLNELYYVYLIENRNGIRITEESGLKHHFLFNQRTTYHLYDDWMTKSADDLFYSAAFSKNIFARNSKDNPTIRPEKQTNIVLQVRAPVITPNQKVALTGNQPCLGDWNPQQALCLSDNHFPLWETTLHADDISFPFVYKFVVLDGTTNRLCYWEEGENRVLHQPQFIQNDPIPPDDHKLSSIEKKAALAHSRSDCIRIDGYRLRAPQSTWKTCGTVIPVFSLRSEQSFGIGDIDDIKKIIDWARATDQHVIQVLPMNDTTRTHTWKDSYPYSAISIYALHPLYIHLPTMGELHDKKKKAYYQKIQLRLNEKETVDYQSVEKYKTAYYRDYFDQEKDNILKNKDFQKFIAQNKDWLIPYAAFSFLRDLHQSADFSKWGEDARYNRKKMERFCQPESETFLEFTYLFFIQYMLHKQMTDVFRYARENRVILKGDLPIGISRESVEAWTEPDYFNRQVQAGAPPDIFSGKGQNWSFPTYNWEAMKQDGFGWWKKRFQNLQQYFDSIRIDHILGFFRIWEIPYDYTEGLCGYFNPALPLLKTEIEQYGMLFDDQWLSPRIHHKYLSELVGDEDISNYLHPCDAEHLALNENCSTQRKIEYLFNNQRSRKSQIIKNGLMIIANETLFIRKNREYSDSDEVSDESLFISDQRRPIGFHPRIMAFQSYAYRELSEQNRQAFDRLYRNFFFERHNQFWKETALHRLQPLLGSTRMLVCGEDLGMIPASVHEVMGFLQILSLELERMPKDTENEFTDLRKLPYLAVCTTSTHDMNPIRAWWNEDKEKIQRYYNNILQHSGIAPDKCTADLAEEIIINHLNASSMLTMIPIQDWFAIDDTIAQPDANTERINNPANANHYWRYRMHINIETLLQSTNLNEKILAMITGSGR